MSQDQQVFTPEQQQQVFQKMQEAGLLSKDIGQSTSNQDTQAQGPGYIDPTTLHSIIQHALNPNSVPMQQGDKMHPMNAIAQISQKLQGNDQAAPVDSGQPSGPSIPSGFDKTSPDLQIVHNAPANGLIPKLLGEKIPGNSIQLPAQGLIPKLLGLKTSVPVNGQNYFDAAKAAGIDKYLPDGLARMPDGTPFVGKQAFTTALMAHRVTQNPNNPPVSLQDAKDMNIISDREYNNLLANGAKPTDEKPATVWRLSSAGRMAGAREGLVALGNNKLEQGMIQDLVNNVSDATSKGPAAIQANTLQWAIHGRQIVSGAYNPQTQTYDLKPQQLAELTMDLNRIMTGSSQVAESARADINAATAQGAFAKLAQYAGINDFNGTSQDLAKMYINMLDRQGTTSNDLLNATLARQIPRGQLLAKLNPYAYKAVMDNAFGTSDYRQFLQSLPDASQTQIPPQLNLGGRGQMPPAPKASGVWKVIR